MTLSTAGTAASTATGERLSRRLREAQRDRRIPAISAAVSRAGADFWADAVHAGADEQFRLGSITKTFTAVLVLQCRDAGLLDLDDPVSVHLPLATPPGVTLRRLLSHGAGVQREPEGEIWSGGEQPGADELLAGVAATEQVLPPARRFHYSNLGFALLGQVVAAKRQTSWQQALSTCILDPLGLTRTTLAPASPHATGGYVDPWSDLVTPEPHTDMRAVSPAAQLWATAHDLARWGAFLARPDPAVLTPAALEEMCEVTVMADPLRWSVAFGLGLMLFRRGDRVFVGHGGAMPGFLAGLAVDRDSGVAAAVLTATGVGADAEMLACSLIEDVLEHDPDPVAPWLPAAAPPPAVAALLGRWWTEGNELTLSWHGRLEARLAAAPAWRPPAVFEQLPDDGSGERWRTVSGRESGELLRVRRDPDGSVAGMSWATYALTRSPDSFSDLAADRPGEDH